MTDVTPQQSQHRVLDTGMQTVWHQRENFRRLFAGRKFIATDTRLCNFGHQKPLLLNRCYPLSHRYDYNKTTTRRG